jgi:hypothetical protein
METGRKKDSVETEFDESIESISKELNQNPDLAKKFFNIMRKAKLPEQIQEEKIARGNLERLISETQKVEKIKPDLHGDNYAWNIHVRDKILKIPSPQMITARVFKIRYLEECNEIVNIDKKWTAYVNRLGDITEEVQNDAPSNEKYVVSKVLETLKDCEVTLDYPTAKTERRTLFIKGEPIDALYYYNGHLQTIIKETHLKMDLRRLSDLLEEYRLTGPKSIKRNDQKYQFWVFKPDLLGVDWNQRIRREED